MRICKCVWFSFEVMSKSVVDESILDSFSQRNISKLIQNFCFCGLVFHSFLMAISKSLAEHTNKTKHNIYIYLHIQ